MSRSRIFDAVSVSEEAFDEIFVRVLQLQCELTGSAPSYTNLVFVMRRVDTFESMMDTKQRFRPMWSVRWRGERGAEPRRDIVEGLTPPRAMCLVRSLRVRQP